jgi:hypothetical protein
MGKCISIEFYLLLIADTFAKDNLFRLWNVVGWIHFCKTNMDA